MLNYVFGKNTWEKRERNGRRKGEREAKKNDRIFVSIDWFVRKKVKKI